MLNLTTGAFMKTVEILKVALADTYALYLKTQNYHWNVTGIHFISLHQLFERQYNELAEAVDEIAERIRALGEKTPASFSAFSALTKVKEGNENADAKTMLADLVKSHEQVVVSVTQAKEAAAKNDDYATEDMMIGRLEEHQKSLWMLRASLMN